MPWRFVQHDIVCLFLPLFAPHQVYEHYKGLMADSFDSSPGFRAVLDEACKSFVNAVPQASEWLARYAHCLLDKVCMPPLALLSRW